MILIKIVKHCKAHWVELACSRVQEHSLAVLTAIIIIIIIIIINGRQNKCIASRPPDEELFQKTVRYDLQAQVRFRSFRGAKSINIVPLSIVGFATESVSETAA